MKWAPIIITSLAVRGEGQGGKIINIRSPRSFPANKISNIENTNIINNDKII